MNNTSTMNQSTQNFTDWDDFINEEPTKTSRIPRKKSKILNLDDEDETSKLQTVNQKTPSKEKAERFGTSADPLMKDARDKLNYYLKRIPSFSTLSSQINILNSEMNVYKKSGDLENQNKCKEILITLQEKAKEIKSVFTSVEGEKAKAKRLETLANIKASTVIKDLMSKEKEIKKNISDNSVNKILQNISQLRKMLKFVENEDEIVDFDDYISDDKNSEVYKNYDVALKQVSEITGLEVNELKEMPINHIKEYLNDNTGVEYYNEELKIIRAQIQNEKDNLSGALTLSNIINNLYDIKTNEKDVSSVKEILASSHIGMVKSAAYSVCTSVGGKSSQYYDDCVSAGLLALTGAINDWIKLQQSYPVSLSFKGWARVNITNAIKRELYSQQSGGRLSGSRMADMISRENKKIGNFLKNFPQYAEFDKEFVRELVTSIDVGDSGRKITTSNDIKSIVSESDIMASAEDGNGADMWANLNSDENTDVTEAKSEYNALINSISALMSTMNKFEKKLFMMYFGFEKKLERENDKDKKTVSNKYTQAEIGVELYNFYVANGAKPKALNNSFSQPAIYDKIKKLEKHISTQINENPQLKLGFDYLFIYWTQNSQLLEIMSNNREEIGMKLERDTLRTYYADDPETSSIQLSDGKRLSDIFDISASNPLDTDIEDFYNNSTK